jgi:3D-(3,5/4)-trihydroxycyclohexane-1,2-dione acylhydrolase (decyclizing)
MQYSERDGREQRLVEGVSGIFGHGNLAGIGEALLSQHLADPELLPYRQTRNEQAMVHTAAAYARMKNRLSTLACTTSVGPGATNMVTGAALATINRLPVLLLPADVFATRRATPVLQELEHPSAADVSVNDCFRPVSKFFDRVSRPEQLPAALLGAMRALTDAAECGAVTISLPQDVQTEAFDWPETLFVRRVWHVDRPEPDAGALARSVDAIRAAKRPLIVAGGGVIYSDACAELRAFVEATGIPVAETQAGKGSLRFDNPLNAGAMGATGTEAANQLAADADLVIGIGTRWSDFTTASRSAFANPAVQFVNVNVARFDAVKQAGVAVTADARAWLTAAAAALAGWGTDDEYRVVVRDLSQRWNSLVDGAFAATHTPLPSQAEVIGVVNAGVGDRDVVVCAAGSMPGDLHRLWRSRDAKQYHVEYGYSCMGYEIAGGVGVKLAAPDRNVVVMVGDGSYLMMAQEIVTAVAEGIPIVVVLVENHGFASIGALSESIGAQRFGTKYDANLAVDLAANAESLGATVIRAASAADLRDALRSALGSGVTTVIHIETDPLLAAPSGGGWWDVPVAEVSGIGSTQTARTEYEAARTMQRPLL